MDLRARRSYLGDLPVLALIGEVDLASVPVLGDALLDLISDERGVRVALDMDGVSALDDTGLGVILGAAARARAAGGDLVVVCSNRVLRRRFTDTRLDRAVDVADALAQVAGRSH
jgi:anti-sigma B factor antagonist